MDTKTFGVEPMLFKPTKRWLREHTHKPDICRGKNTECTCIWDSFDKRTGRGFCVGLYENHNDLDVISLCTVTWNPHTKRLENQGGVFHPQEALLISELLNTSVIQLLHMLPAHKTIMHKMLLAAKRQQKNAHGLKDDV